MSLRKWAHIFLFGKVVGDLLLSLISHLKPIDHHSFFLLHFLGEVDYVVYFIVLLFNSWIVHLLCRPQLRHTPMVSESLRSVLHFAHLHVIVVSLNQINLSWLGNSILDFLLFFFYLSTNIFVVWVNDGFVFVYDELLGGFHLHELLPIRVLLHFLLILVLLDSVHFLGLYLLHLLHELLLSHRISYPFISFFLFLPQLDYPCFDF